MKASRTRQQDDMENFYASLYENNHVVILLIDPTDGSIVDANPAAESFYGWTREELKRKNIADINTLAPAQIHEEMQAAHEARRNHFLFRHRRADGQQFSFWPDRVSRFPQTNQNRSIFWTSLPLLGLFQPINPTKISK
jgi:PAS domain S-box-containing protein